MIRKVRFPLKIKISGLIFALLLATSVVYLYFAANLFKADKSAYIFEDTLKTNESIHSIIKLEIARARELQQFVLKLPLESSSFDSLPHLLEYSLFQVSPEGMQLQWHQSNKSIIEEYGLLPDYLVELNKKFPLPLNQLISDPNRLFAHFSGDDIPHLIVGAMIQVDGQKKLIVLRVLANHFFQILNQDNKYTNYILTTNGDSFANIAGHELKQRAMIIKTIMQKQNNGVIEMPLDQTGDQRLIAFSFLKEHGLVIISEIPQTLAFQAEQYLINKSFFFGLLLMSLSVIVGIIFSRRLTNNLTRLAVAAEKVSTGDFNQYVKVKSKDELGALSDSFNSMAKKIKTFMEEMKEKARLEGELEVARLVQEAFIPPTNLRCKNVELATYYRSASECGGDWWSYIEKDRFFVFFIADATGHGVPAAFLTATANCCATNILYYADRIPELIQSPNQILKLMNNAIRAMGNNIHMTALVGVIDQETGKLTYSNASHPHAYFLPKKANGNYSKKDIQVLLGESGPRLGHQEDYQYLEHTIQLEEEDTLVFYTDGLLENTNSQAQAFGTRRLGQSLLAQVDHDLTTVRDTLVSSLTEHQGLAPLVDDITLVLCRYHRHQAHDHVEQWDYQDALAKGSTQTSWEKIAVVSDQQNELNILHLLQHFPIRHLIGKNSSALIKEVHHYSSPKYSSENFYLTSPKLEHRIKINSTEQRERVVEELAQIYQQCPHSNTREQSDRLKLMANELLNNAFYHQSTALNHDRQQPINLQHQSIEITIQCSDEATLLSVVDPFGKLCYENLQGALVRGFKEKTPIRQSGGAGLGLYLCFNFSHQLIVNVIPNHRTEIICVIEHKRRYKDHQARITSFHFNQFELEK